MGVSHSGHPRSVNMDNQMPIGVVEVSEDVVKRLKIGLTKESKKSASASSEQSNVIQNPTPIPSQPLPQTTPSQSPPVVYIDPSMSVIEARRQKVQELQQIDAYWKKRMGQLEQNLNKTNKIMEDEYSATIEDVKKRFATSQLYPSQQLSLLQDLKIQLIACFRANRHEPLKCSEEVKAFTDCVSKCRVKKLDEGIEETQKGSKSTVEKPKISPSKAA
ncbi:uncharacterized protein LOC129606508 [Condylostylus longicornis]|uniref:uncharacterized protein LOC129606508 n=1 Tax=Condylostylus longicornis TaxID=2530218 RepID=UPI00244DD49D|nr:uncharacterized protein LOC129606508 [Condylostylus longicornis]